MVNPSEMRIGNYYLATDGSGICQVTIDDLIAWSKGAKYGENLTLTKDLFIKLGFKRHVDEWQKARYNVYKPVNYVGYLFCENNLVLREIKYVHTLQNLYFILIGDELTI